MTYPVCIRGTGHYLPENLLTNKDLEQMVDTSDEWIKERTGILSRHKVASHEATSDLCLEASVKALEMAQMKATEVDMILVATVTPDYLMPSTACILQHKLKAKNCMAFDLLAACSGFLYAFSVASEFIKTGRYKNILVVGADTMTKIVNYEDRKTCVLFGDGAGAALLSKNNGKENSFVFGHYMQADGSLASLISIPSGGSQNPISQENLDKKLHFIQMNGQKVFKEAVHTLSDSSKKILADHKMHQKDIDWMIPHQANKRILGALVKQLNFPIEKVLIEVERMGNTSAASVPTALDMGIRDGRIQRGQNLLLNAFGAGITSGSLLLKY